MTEREQLVEKKLYRLAVEDQGRLSVDDFVQWLLTSGKGMDSAVWGICMNPACNYITDEDGCEPDASKEKCQECKQKTLTSIILIVAERPLEEPLYGHPDRPIGDEWDSPTFDQFFHSREIAHNQRALNRKA